MNIMIKRTILSVVLLSGIALSACQTSRVGSSQASVGISSSGAMGTQALNQGVELPLALRLALGTLLLDKTDYPVDAEQAAKLLPLWKAARTLSKSELAAVEEMNGLLKQIQSTMTSQQLQAIQSMELTMQNLPTIAQELGINLGWTGQVGGTGSTSGSSSGTTRRSGEAPFMGGPPDAAGGFPMGAPGGSNTRTGQTTQSGRGGTFLGVNSALLEAVIAHLKAKVQ